MEGINIEKLVDDKIKSLIECANTKDWLELKQLVKFTKFSFDNLVKKTNIEFDRDNDKYKLFISLLPNANDMTFRNISNLLIKLTEGLNSSLNTERLHYDIKDQAEFDENYPSIESSLISKLMELDVCDFNKNLEILKEIDSQVQDAYGVILHSNMKKSSKSYIVLHILGEMYERLGYQKKDMNDLVDSNLMDSLVISLNASNSKFKGLVTNYLKSDKNNSSLLSKRIQLSYKILCILHSNLTESELDELHLDSYGLHGEPILFDINKIDFK